MDHLWEDLQWDRLWDGEDHPFKNIEQHFYIFLHYIDKFIILGQTVYPSNGTRYFKVICDIRRRAYDYVIDMFFAGMVLLVKCVCLLR